METQPDKAGHYLLWYYRIHMRGHQYLCSVAPVP